MKSGKIISGLVALACLAAISVGAFAQKAQYSTTEVLLAAPTPIVVSGTPSCADLNASSNPAFAHIAEDWGFRINRSGATPFDRTFPFVNGTDTQLQGGAGPSPTRYVHVAAGGNTISWDSNRTITAVIVQGGPLGAFVYPYNPASFGGFPNSDGAGLMTAGGCATIDHLTFCFQDLEPTAAPASVSGRVATSGGRGISGARMTLTNAQTGQSFGTLTNSFGYFAIRARAGGFYILTVSHPRYSFADGSRTFTLNEDVADMDFVADP